jgi:hypothetical protein
MNHQSSTPDADLIESALAPTGLAWSRRDNVWAIPAADVTRPEIVLRPVAGGVRVEAVLIQADELAGAETAALVEFLRRAQADLRGARCEMDASGACASAEIATERLEEDLAVAIAAVADACRRMRQEARALLRPAVARAYLNLDFGPPSRAGPLSSTVQPRTPPTSIGENR